MGERSIEDAFKEELLKGRAQHFRKGAAFATRLVQDYQEKPQLLAVDLAWVVMTALCAANLAGVQLDLDAAVAAGQKLYEREGFSDAAAPRQDPA